MDDQRARITEALREACEIVDEVLPRELPPRARPAADLTELRKAVLPVVLGVLLSLPGAPAVPDTAGSRDDEVVGPARISELYDISPGTIRQWTALGILAPVTRGHRKLYRRSDVSRVVAMRPEERDALRKPPAVIVSGQHIDRMREDGLAWNEITSKTGLGRSALRTVHMKWLSEQLEAAAGRDPASPEEKAGAAE
jgi:hypothetical protein